MASAQRLPPMRRLLMLAVIGAVLIGLINIPSIMSYRKSEQEKVLLQEQLIKAQTDLKDSFQELEVVRTSADARVKDARTKLKLHDDDSKKEKETLLDSITELKKELTEKKEKLAAAEKEHKLPAFMGTKVNQRFFKTEFSKEAPEYRKVIYKAADREPGSNEMAILISIANGGSYGNQRTFDDLMKTINTMEFDRSKSTLGLLVSTKDEFAVIVKYLDLLEDDTFFSKVIVLQAQFIEDFYRVDRDTRHSLSVQKERRRIISRARNFLVTHALGDESYTLCVDADMIDLPSDLLTLFISTGKDIIVPRIRQGGAENYDFNSWAGARVVPTPEEDAQLDNDPGFLFVPRPDGAGHMHDFVNEEKWGNNGERDFAVKLDSVGGAVLFVKSEIFKQGIMFPPFYVVGTKWTRMEGYDGIETEGLCFQARTIGYSCWGLPNVVAFHETELQDG